MRERTVDVLDRLTLTDHRQHDALSAHLNEALFEFESLLAQLNEARDSTCRSRPRTARQRRPQTERRRSRRLDYLEVNPATQGSLLSR